MSTLTLCCMLAGLGAAPVETSREPITRLFIETRPPGAAVKIDGKAEGVCPKLFVVPSEARTMTVEVALDGHQGQQRVVEIQGGQITRIEFRLAPQAPIKTAEEPRPTAGSASGASTGRGGVGRKTIHEKVSEYPKGRDLSTPDAACAAWNRACAAADVKAIVELSWVKLDPADEARFWKRLEQEDPEGVYRKALAEAEIIDVLIYRDELAAVITLLPFPPGKGRDPYSLRSFGRIEGQWKNLGEDRLPSLEAARETFEMKAQALWRHFEQVRSQVTGTPAGQPAPRKTKVPLGKVTELKLFSIRSGRESLADLSTAAVIAPDFARFRGDDPQGRAWLEEQGIDLVAYDRTDSGDCGLGGYGMRAVKIDDGKFDTLAPDEARQMIKKAEKETRPLPPATLMSTKAGLPVTFVFSTRRGTIGVLQITQAEPKDSATIFGLRYKLLADR